MNEELYYKTLFTIVILDRPLSTFANLCERQDDTLTCTQILVVASLIYRKVK